MKYETIVIGYLPNGDPINDIVLIESQIVRLTKEQLIKLKKGYIASASPLTATKENLRLYQISRHFSRFVGEGQSNATSYNASFRDR